MADYKTNKTEFLAFKTQVLNDFDLYLCDELNVNLKKVALITYWLRDQKNFFKQEKTFHPKYLPIYKKGSIVQVNLGFNIGKEYGGLHYAIVLNSKDTKHNPVLTVLPLSSIKEDSKLDKIMKLNIFLGSEVYTLCITKANTLLDQCNSEIENIRKDSNNPQNINKIKDLQKKITYLDTCIIKFRKMQRGSFGIHNQITTVSKMRIHDPIKAEHPLSDLVISKETQKLISKKISEYLDI